MGREIDQKRFVLEYWGDDLMRWKERNRRIEQNIIIYK
jgi:hypothetical protein